MKYLLSDIARMCGGVLHGGDIEVRGVTADSRSCAYGGDVLFAAMRGANRDSHDYVGEMYDRGVRAFMVERIERQMPRDGAGYVVVDNSVEALQLLAAAHRAAFRGVMVGITGSNGKTVVKEWTACSLPPSVRFLASPMSYNSQLGVALSLLMIEGDEDVALIEAGISERGEMERLERMIRPDVVLFTSIGEAHQANFSTLREKVDEKMVLARNARTFIYHGSYGDVAEALTALPATCRIVDASTEDISELPACNEALRIDAQEVKSLCRELGYAVPRLSPADAAMRMEVKEGVNGSTIIVDSYNSDINSLALALDTLRDAAAGGPSTAVIYDMSHSGMDDAELYARVARLISNAGVDRVVGVGERIRAHAGAFDCDKRFYDTTEELLSVMTHGDAAGRAILLKGDRRAHFDKVCRALERRCHTTVLEVNLNAMTHNVNYFRRFLPMNHRLVAMVKAHSYGTGDAEVAQLMRHLGVDYLAVAFADEGITLRERGVTMPVVVLNADEASFDKMIAYSLEPEIYSFHSLGDFIRCAERYGVRNYPIHVKLDTGMHRWGFIEDEIDRVAEILRTTAAVRAATVFSHLSCADDPVQDDFTRGQIARFDRMSRRLSDALPYTPIRHTANSAAIERFPEAHFDMCRLGLGLYGYGYRHNDELQPVATMKTRIVQIRGRRAGDAIGYGRSQRLERDSLIATIPIGYADGLDRHLGGGRWSMLVAGRPAPTVGRICMDSCMIDVTGIDGVREGDEAVVFSAAAGNTLEDMADVLGTISYEIMTSVAMRVKRIYTRE